MRVMQDTDGSPRKKSVLFLCTYNSVRSQIAEGLIRTLYPDRFSVYSAGIAPAGIHPLAIRTLKEIGIDITGQRSKSVREFRDREFDYVITFSNEVHDTHGITTPKSRVYLNRPVKSPSDVYDDDDAALADFRQVRESIRSIIIQAFSDPEA
jgi:arsenate reductase (thioredoxin)